MEPEYHNQDFGWRLQMRFVKMHLQYPVKDQTGLISYKRYSIFKTILVAKCK